MQPWPLVSHLAEFLGETAETEDCRRRILRIRRLGVRIPPGALCVETDDQALTSGNAGWGLCRSSSTWARTGSLWAHCGRIGHSDRAEWAGTSASAASAAARPADAN